MSFLLASDYSQDHMISSLNIDVKIMQTRYRLTNILKILPMKANVTDTSGQSVTTILTVVTHTEERLISFFLFLFIFLLSQESNLKWKPFDGK
jgi:hypothetical protein